MISRESMFRQQTNADVLLWQGRLRIAFAGIIATIGCLLRLTGVVGGAPTPLAAIATMYIVAQLALQAWFQRTGRAPTWMLAVTIGLDLSAIFGATLFAVSPRHYDHALILSLFTLQLTLVYFGRVAASWTLAAIVGGYGGLIAAASVVGEPVVAAEELWILGLFGGAAAGLITQYGHFQERLGGIVRLFERAEEGDFSETYDVAADHRPDSITRVGRAYNRFRSQLATLVLTDPLSGCLNRRGFDQQLHRELARASRSGGELAMLAIDVDNFKEINDGHGHLVGDDVIREIGAVLRGRARTGDVVARLGGDEFALLLPDTDEEGARHLAQRIREAFQEFRFRTGRQTVGVAVSMGVAATLGSGDGSAEDLRARADEALYAAKRRGRDAIQVWRLGLRAGMGVTLPPVDKPEQAEH
ncbi:MAG TPA: GGDEF domain-containing protein [Gemmatimonadaceae bacterium]|nr:GGDEF domain-containing protein [Gemmatimonadaceae bacterium]